MSITLGQLKMKARKSKKIRKPRKNKTKDKATRRELLTTPAGVLGVIMILSSPTLVPDANAWAGLILLVATMSFMFLFIYFSIRIRHYERAAIFETLKHMSILLFASTTLIAFFGALYGYGYIVTSPNPLLEFAQSPLIIALLVSMVLSSAIDMLGNN